MTDVDKLRAVLIMFVQSIFPVALIFGVNLTNEQVGAIILAINNGLTLVFLLWKPKPEATQTLTITKTDNTEVADA